MPDFLQKIFVEYYLFILQIFEFFQNIDFKILYKQVEFFSEYIKDSKDVLLGFLGVIFAIYIPFLLYFYQEIDKKKQYKILDLYLFQSRVFNLKQIIGRLIFLVIILLFWNEQEEGTYFFVNIIILILSIPVWIFLIHSLLKLYDLNLELKNENSSGNLDDLRIEGLKKLDIKKENVYIWNDAIQDIIFQNYKFTQQFFEILFEKIKIIAKGERDFKKEGLVRTLLQKYNELNNINISESFLIQDAKKILEIYKLSKFYLGNFLTLIYVNKLSQRIGSRSLGLMAVESFLEENKLDQELVFYLLRDLNNTILNKPELLENSDFMEEYGSRIFHKYKDNYFNRTENNIFIILMRKIIPLVLKESKYNPGYDNIFYYWLLDFDPITFAELFYLTFTSSIGDKATRILNQTYIFGGMSRIYDMNDKNINSTQDEIKETIQNFKKYFAINKDELTQLKEQFRALIDEGKLEANKIHYAENYISLIEKLLAD